MERQRYDLDHVFVLQLVVLPQVVEKSLLVANEIVKLEMIVYFLPQMVSLPLFEEVLGEVSQPVCEF